MRPFRFTIAQGMGLTAALSAERRARACLCLPADVRSAILIFIALQVGLWCLRCSAGTVRRFWLGFEVIGVSSIAAMFACEVFPDSALNRFLMSYVDFATNLAFLHLPVPLADHVDEHQDQLLAVVYFIPELVAALLGGVTAGCLYRSGKSTVHTGPADSRA